MSPAPPSVIPWSSPSRFGEACPQVIEEDLVGGLSSGGWSWTSKCCHPDPQHPMGLGQSPWPLGP